MTNGKIHHVLGLEEFILSKLLPKVIYRLNAISIKMPMAFLDRTRPKMALIYKETDLKYPKQS